MNKRLGKFEGNDDQDLGEALYEITLDGNCDDDLGESESFGWYGLILEYDNGKSYIVSEDSQGFFDYQEYETTDAAKKHWAKIQDAYDEWNGANDDNEE
jgi:hypothetical protein